MAVYAMNISMKTHLLLENITGICIITSLEWTLQEMLM